MSSGQKEDLVEEILSLADKLFRRLLPTVPEDLLTLDVTIPQFKIMMILFVHGHLKMSSIASGLGVTLPTSTSLIDRLVEKGFIVRESQTDDRRVVLCKLSETGQKAIGQIWESSRIRSQQLLQAIDATKLEMLSEVLEDMIKSAEAQSSLNNI